MIIDQWMLLITENSTSLKEITNDHKHNADDAALHLYKYF